jgi:hypothetical protein
MPATFIILAVGRDVVLRPEWARSMGFTRGRVLQLHTPLDRAIADGGTYRVQRIDGPDDLRDLQHDLNRTTFVPTSAEREARRASVAAYRAAKTAAQNSAG